ncbi:unnamed protein product [Amoebophrya sp. A120]|nr:unnamed protein product [Amoebophrya sp. A120]|eukprot:GSA120T00002146001.1
MKFKLSKKSEGASAGATMPDQRKTSRPFPQCTHAGTTRSRSPRRVQSNFVPLRPARIQLQVPRAASSTAAPVNDRYVDTVSSKDTSPRRKAKIQRLNEVEDNIVEPRGEDSSSKQHDSIPSGTGTAREATGVMPAGRTSNGARTAAVADTNSAEKPICDETSKQTATAEAAGTQRKRARKVQKPKEKAQEQSGATSTSLLSLRDISRKHQASRNNTADEWKNSKHLQEQRAPDESQSSTTSDHSSMRIRDEKTDVAGPVMINKPKGGLLTSTSSSSAKKAKVQEHEADKELSEQRSEPVVEQPPPGEPTIDKAKAQELSDEEDADRRAQKKQSDDEAEVFVDPGGDDAAAASHAANQKLLDELLANDGQKRRLACAIAKAGSVREFMRSLEKAELVEEEPEDGFLDSEDEVWSEDEGTSSEEEDDGTFEEEVPLPLPEGPRPGDSGFTRFLRQKLHDDRIITGTDPLFPKREVETEAVLAGAATRQDHDEKQNSIVGSSGSSVVDSGAAGADNRSGPTTAKAEQESPLLKAEDQDIEQSGSTTGEKRGSSCSGVAPLLTHQKIVRYVFERGYCPRLLVDHATGSGKTRTQIELLTVDYLRARTKIVILPKKAHVDNLFKELLRWPNPWRDFFAVFCADLLKKLKFFAAGGGERSTIRSANGERDHGEKQALPEDGNKKSTAVLCDQQAAERVENEATPGATANKESGAAAASTGATASNADAQQAADGAEGGAKIDKTSSVVPFADSDWSIFLNSGSMKSSKKRQTLYTAFRDCVGLKGLICGGRLRKGWAKKFFRQHHVRPPAAPLRIFNYTTAGGSAMGFSREGKATGQIDACLKFKLVSKEDVYAGKLILMDEAHNLVRPAEERYRPALNRLRDAVANTCGYERPVAPQRARKTADVGGCVVGESNCQSSSSESAEANLGKDDARSREEAGKSAGTKTDAEEVVTQADTTRDHQASPSGCIAVQTRSPATWVYLMTATPIQPGVSARSLLDLVKGLAPATASGTVRNDAGFLSAFHAKSMDLYPRVLVAGPGGHHLQHRNTLSNGLQMSTILSVPLIGKSLSHYILKHSVEIPRQDPKREVRLAKWTVCAIAPHYVSAKLNQGGSTTIEKSKSYCPKIYRAAAMIRNRNQKALVLVSRKTGFLAAQILFQKVFGAEKVATFRDVAQFNDDAANARGENKLVLLATKEECQEGVEFRCVREFHILDVPSDPAEYTQIVGRPVRVGSHAALPPSERTVTLYVHAATLPRWLREDEEDELHVGKSKPTPLQETRRWRAVALCKTKNWKDENLVKGLQKWAAQGEAPEGVKDLAQSDALAPVDTVDYTTLSRLRTTLGTRSNTLEKLRTMALEYGLF